MKKLIIFAIFIFLPNAFALDSMVTFSSAELKKNDTINLVIAGDDNQMPAAAARVFQLELMASNCDHPLVLPQSMVASTKYDFQIKSDNCVIKNKNSESCDAGYNPRNLAVNPNAPNTAIIGGDTYKVCLKIPGGGASQAPLPGSK